MTFQTLTGDWNNRAIEKPHVESGPDRTHRIPLETIITTGYPTDDRRGRPTRERITSFRGPITNNLAPRHLYFLEQWFGKRWLISERFMFPEVVKVDTMGDNAGRILTDHGLYEFDGREGTLLPPHYTLHTGSYHEYGEWDGTPSVGQASWTPRFPHDLVFPGIAIDHRFNLSLPEDVAGYGHIWPALRTDVIEGEVGRTGLPRGNPDGPPMGMVFVIDLATYGNGLELLRSYAADPSMTEVELWTVHFVLNALRLYGAMFGNTTQRTDDWGRGAIGMTEEARTPKVVEILNLALKDCVWVEAEVQR